MKDFMDRHMPKMAVAAVACIVVAAIVQYGR